MSKLINRTGEKLVTNKGESFVILKYVNAHNVDILFENGVILKNRKYDSLKKGSVINPYYPSVYGIGYIGEGDYKSCCYENKHTKCYSLWKSMLRRCYVNTQQEKQPTYKNCKVTKEWHNFQNFAEWFEENWKSKYMQDWQLDKDILIKGNKIYSPETCAFVPQEINKLLVKRDTKREDCPIGVVKLGNKFNAQISVRGKLIYLGIFNTSEEAFEAYKVTKEKYIKEMTEQYRDQITEKVYQALINYQVEITD